MLKVLSKRINVGENYYKQLFDTLDVLVFIIKGDQIVDANKAFKTFFQTSDNDISSLKVSSLFNPVKRYGFIYDGYRGMKWYELIKSDAKDHYKVEVCINSREYIFAISMKSFNLDNGLDIVTMTEVTGMEGYKKTLENDVFATKSLIEQYQNALDQTNLITKTDTHGFVIDVNEEFCRVMGYSKEELLGVHYQTFYPPSEADNLDKIRSSLAKKEVYRGVVANIQKYGEIVYFNLVVIPLFDTNGHLIENISVRQDITSLYRASLEAEKTVEYRTRLLNQVSHEFRTPLNAIINFVDQILEDFDEIDDVEVQKLAKTYLERSMSNSRHLLSLVNNLLDVAQLNDNKDVYDIKDLYLGDILAEVYENTVSLTRFSGVEYQFLAYQLPGIVSVDPLKFRQCLINLLGNAIKFTKKGSIQLILTKENDEFVIKVKDTGKGIDPEKLNSIFDPFVQAEKGDIGTGLGLSIAKEHCDAMGIVIGVESIVEQGTIFTLRVKEKAKKELL